MSKVNQSFVDIVKEKQELNSRSNTNIGTNITVRLSPEDGTMLKEISEYFDLPISTSFSKALSESIMQFFYAFDESEREEIFDIFSKKGGFSKEMCNNDDKSVFSSCGDRSIVDFDVNQFV